MKGRRRWKSGAKTWRRTAFGLAMTALLFGLSGVQTSAGKAGPTTLEKPFGTIERLDPRVDDLIDRDARLEVLAEGFTWLEGPVWNKEEGYLLFSEIPKNAIHRWDAEQGVRLFLSPSGYSGATMFQGREPGSNGLTYDPRGTLVLCEHGDRRVTRLGKEGRRTILADRYQGKRLNSPNDLVFKSDGSLYFTDPPFGLPRTFDDPEKELPFSGVYRLSSDGTLTLLADEIKAPNGIAFSPDEKTLYITDVNPARSAWLSYPVRADGTLGDGRVFFDATDLIERGEGGPDGIKVDIHGNLYGAGPGAVYIFAPDGTLLGSIFTGVPTGNLAWGEDGSTLFITAASRLLRIRTGTTGAGFQ